MSTDFSSGLPVDREQIVADEPDVPFWTENLLFCPYDPKADIGGWLHLGSVPNDFSMWEDRVLVCLPGDEGVLSMWAYYRPEQEKKPSGANLSAKCIEPFKRWKVTFDGFAEHTSNADMQAGISPQGLRHRLVIDLDVEAIMPVWDAHSSASAEGGKGSMESQGWAKEHYEQMYRATGTITVGTKTYPYDGIGWRDHSRGPRGGNSEENRGEEGSLGDAWGGHVIAGAVFPSGRSIIYSRYWRPDGLINLEGGCVYEPNGDFHYAEVAEAPRLTKLQWKDEKLPVHLTWKGGELKATMTTARSIWTSMQKRIVIGKDLTDRGLMYVLNFGPIECNGEIGHMYIERSDALNDLPKEIKSA